MARTAVPAEPSPAPGGPARPGGGASRPGGASEAAAALKRWLLGWWQVVELGTLLLALALSPSSWRAGLRRDAMRHLVLATGPLLPWFGVLTTLIALVLIRIVVVTADSYDLSRYALEMVVRVLVLELIPLTAALFAALRCTIPQAAQVAALRASGRWDAMRGEGREPLRDEVLPRAGAGLFCALLLAAVSSVVTFVVSYLLVYGPTTAGFAAYTRTVGQVFSPAVSLVFALKILCFSAAVTLLPLATVLHGGPRRRPGTSAELQGLVRMALVIVLVEAASLVGNYA